MTNAPIPAPEKRKPFGVDIRPLPHAAYLKECISQDAETGFLYWRERHHGFVDREEVAS